MKLVHRTYKVHQGYRRIPELCKPPAFVIENQKALGLDSDSSRLNVYEKIKDGKQNFDNKLLNPCFGTRFNFNGKGLDPVFIYSANLNKPHLYITEEKNNMMGQITYQVVPEPWEL